MLPPTRRPGIRPGLRHLKCPVNPPHPLLSTRPPCPYDRIAPDLPPVLLLLLRRESLLTAIITIPTPPRSQPPIPVPIFIRIPPRLDSRHRRSQLIRS